MTDGIKERQGNHYESEMEKSDMGDSGAADFAVASAFPGEQYPARLFYKSLRLSSMQSRFINGRFEIFPDLGFRYDT